MSNSADQETLDLMIAELKLGSINNQNIAFHRNIKPKFQGGNLTSIYLEDVPLDDVVDYIVDFHQLQTLQLHNYILGNNSTLEKLLLLPNLVTLSLRHVNFTKSQISNVFSHPNIINLEVAYSENVNLSRIRVNLPKIKSIALPGNQLLSFPEKLLQLTTLERLDLSFNQIQSIPQLYTLQSLRNLSLWMNKITLVPDHVMSHPLLEQLDLSGNPVALQRFSFKYLSKKLRIIFSKSEIFR